MPWICPISPTLKLNTWFHRSAPWWPPSDSSSSAPRAAGCSPGRSWCRRRFPGAGAARRWRWACRPVALRPTVNTTLQSYCGLVAWRNRDQNVRYQCMFRQSERGAIINTENCNYNRLIVVRTVISLRTCNRCRSGCLISSWPASRPHSWGCPRPRFSGAPP